MTLPAPTGRIYEMGPYRIADPGGRIGWTFSAKNLPYEWRLLRQIRSLGLSGSAFDIGAHVGNHALWMAAVCGLEVHAWEPYPASRRQLEANLALNPGVNIHVYDWAAGDRDGFGEFSEGAWTGFDPSRDGARFLPGTGEEKFLPGPGRIPMHRIDDHLDVSDLAVVKVDVEGMEPEALAGMIRHLEASKPVVYAETHTDEAMERVGAVIGPLGYSKTLTIHMGSRMDRWDCR